MGLIELIVILAVIGVVLYLIETQLPMDSSIKVLIRVVIVVVVILWLLRLFVGDIPIPRLR